MATKHSYSVEWKAEKGQEWNYANWKLEVLIQLMLFGQRHGAEMKQEPVPQEIQALQGKMKLAWLIPFPKLGFVLSLFNSARYLFDITASVETVGDAEKIYIVYRERDNRSGTTVITGSASVSVFQGDYNKGVVARRIDWLQQLKRSQSRVTGPSSIVVHGHRRNEIPVDSVRKITLVNMDSVKAVFDFKAEMVLNMASELRPGGGFLRGTVSQEEALCEKSDLLLRLTESFYPLQNKMLLNNQVQFWLDDKEHACDVVTVSAVKLEWGDEWTMRECDTMDYKIQKLVDEATRYPVCVLGALGCGFYHNPPDMIATLFALALKEAGFRHVVFAILDKTNKIFDTFHKVFKYHGLISG
jgi:uncharacterized protein (TIGR02452 family)